MKNPTSTSNNKLCILNIGSIEPRKGQDILVNSILKLPKEYLGQIEVFLVGRILNESYNSELKKLIGKHNNIHLMGEISQEQLSEIFKDTNIYICTSRDEAFPITILEAMSQNKAIISFNVGGISEMIDDGVNGIVIPFGDTESLRKYIIKLCNDKDYRLSLGTNAHIKFKHAFTIENYGHRFLKLINKIS